jgi:hypothetical protein
MTYAMYVTGLQLIICLNVLKKPYKYPIWVPDNQECISLYKLLVYSLEDCQKRYLHRSLNIPAPLFSHQDITTMYSVCNYFKLFDPLEDSGYYLYHLPLHCKLLYFAHTVHLCVSHDFP